MNWIDLLIIVVVLLSVWAGWRKGFIIGALDLITWLGSLLAGFFFYPYLATLLQQIAPGMGVWIPPVSFIVMILLARILIGVIVNAILRVTHREAHYNGANKFLGIIPGAINGIVWAVIVSAILLAIPISDGVAAATRNSRIAGSLGMQAQWLEAKLSPVFDEAVNKTINNLTIRPESGEMVNLPFTVDDPDIRRDLEKQMLVLINKERAREGLPALEADPELAVVARKHSADMFARGYFSHVSPEGDAPSDRIREEGVGFLTAGENLAFAKTLKIAHEGLMNSPGHRANILSPSYGRVGIGILEGGFHGLMITQNFRN